MGGRLSVSVDVHVDARIAMWTRVYTHEDRAVLHMQEPGGAAFPDLLVFADRAGLVRLRDVLSDVIAELVEAEEATRTARATDASGAGTAPVRGAA